MSNDASAWLQNAMSVFGEACRQRLSGPGDQEAAIRPPLESLLNAFSEHIGIRAALHEVRGPGRVLSDYSVSVDRAIIGHIEVKAPGHTLEPTKFSGHDLEQWNRHRSLPNLIYTNGTQWRLYRDGALLIVVDLGGGELTEAGSGLYAPVGLEWLLTDFLRWRQAPITPIGTVAQTVARMTRLLRGGRGANNKLSKATGFRAPDFLTDEGLEAATDGEDQDTLSSRKERRYRPDSQ